jgi:hypothetical protein
VTSDPRMQFNDAARLIEALLDRADQLFVDGWQPNTGPTGHRTIALLVAHNHIKAAISSMCVAAPDLFARRNPIAAALAATDPETTR